MKTIDRDIHTIDATGKTPGRLATAIARLLIGKHRPSYAPNVDGGDHVQITNAAKMRLTGKKLEQKVYYRHTEYANGLKTQTMRSVWTKDPADVLRRAVSRMLPKNKLRAERMKRLVVKN
ncbi:50S ribosomal protein L13 [Candidatus Parcubacteria bacterium]|nr:50S ribosomal protein L13 [Candidatus Parcubacteria bacterium]